MLISASIACVEKDARRQRIHTKLGPPTSSISAAAKPGTCTRVLASRYIQRSSLMIALTHGLFVLHVWLCFPVQCFWVTSHLKGCPSRKKESASV